MAHERVSPWRLGIYRDTVERAFSASRLETALENRQILSFMTGDPAVGIIERSDPRYVLKNGCIVAADGVTEPITNWVRSSEASARSRSSLVALNPFSSTAA